MAVLDFPTLAGVTYPVKRFPQWDTEEFRTKSGRRTTLGFMSYPIYNYELPYSFLRTGQWQNQAFKEIEELTAFFNRVGGKRDLWAYNDPDRNTATVQFFGTGDGVTALFQLLTQTAGNSNVWYDPVFAPTITTIFVNAVAQVLDTDYTVNDTGGITFLGGHIPAAAAELTWTGTFKWLCRFKEDISEFEKFMNNLYRLNKITFDTEKL